MTISRMSLCLRRAGAVPLALACLAGTGAAQSTTPPAATRARVPVDPATGLPPGMPDFRGVYTNRWIVNMADGRFVEKTVQVPFTEKGRAVYKQRAESFQKDDPNMTCQPSGLPRAGGTPYPMKIMQTADEVVLLWEGGLHTFRIIPTDGRTHKPDPWTWYGDSVGRWDGDTLVVDTINFLPQISVRGSDENLHLVERFTRTDADTIEYQITVDDPSVWTASWTARFPMHRTGERMYEYACHEGNFRSVQGILLGARAQEREPRD